MFSLTLTLLFAFFIALGSATVSYETLNGFFDAFNRHDVEGVLSFLSEDCEFHAIAGDDKLGKTFTGKEEIGAAFAATFKAFPDAQWVDAVHHIIPGTTSTHAFSESTFIASSLTSNNEKQQVQARMIDVLHFNDEGKITVKNAFRKNVPFKLVPN